MVSLQEEHDEDKLDYENKDLQFDGISPEEETISNDLGILINNAVESLSAKQRITFVLKHYEGYKIREIAEMLNCKEGTVKKYLFDAVNSLRRKLRPLIAAEV
jgi:RNA polymerase sigma-70 factor (ECF subfamily)